MAHVARQSFRQRGLWKRPRIQAWFEMPDTQFDEKQCYEDFRVTRDTFQSGAIINSFRKRDRGWNKTTRYRNAPSCFWVLSADLLFFGISLGQVTPVSRFFLGERVSLAGSHFCDNYACARDGFMTKVSQTARESVDTNVNIGTVSLLPYLQEVVSAPPKFFCTGATIHLGPLRLSVETMECHAQKLVSTVPKSSAPRVLPIF